MGHTAACIDMYKCRGPLGHNPEGYGVEGYGVYRERRLPDCIC